MLAKAGITDDSRNSRKRVLHRWSAPDFLFVQIHIDLLDGGSSKSRLIIRTGEDLAVVALVINY